MIELEIYFDISNFRGFGVLGPSIKIKLQKHQEIILEDQSDYAATEVVGDIESLLELANSA